MFQQLSLTQALRRIGLAPWFALGIIASGILTNALHSLIDNLTRDLLGIHSPVLGTVTTFFVAGVLGLGVVILVALFAPSPARFVPHSGQGGGAAPRQKRGLILLVSNHDSALFAIRHHFADGPLEKLWLIYSRDSEFTYFGAGTHPLAETIKADAEELARVSGRTLEVILPAHGVSPADAQDTFDVVRRIFRTRSLPTKEIVADFTGGTKPMTVGLIMACMAPDRELEYVAFHPKLKTMHGPYTIDYQAAAFLDP